VVKVFYFKSGVRVLEEKDGLQALLRLISFHYLAELFSDSTKLISREIWAIAFPYSWQWGKPLIFYQNELSLDSYNWNPDNWLSFKH